MSKEFDFIYIAFVYMSQTKAMGLRSQNSQSFQKLENNIQLQKHLEISNFVIGACDVLITYIVLFDFILIGINNWIIYFSIKDSALKNKTKCLEDQK